MADARAAATRPDRSEAMATRSDRSEAMANPRAVLCQRGARLLPRQVCSVLTFLSVVALLARPTSGISVATSTNQGAFAHPLAEWSAPKLSQALLCRETLKDSLKGAIVSSKQEVVRVLCSAESFIFGACGGAAGAAVMFPVEAVKMRMQAIGSSARFEDVLRHALKNEGLTGLYQGLRATVVAVAPEKAVMFGVNAVLRAKAKPLENEQGMLPLPLEMGIGALAGAGQVLFSSPKEMIMVQMQMASQQGMAPSLNNPIVHAQRLGVGQLYRGCSATLFRDVPFAALYFASYSRVKLWMQGESERLSFVDTLLAATVAALPVAFLTTPADVMKTRLQAAAGMGGPRLGLPQIARQIYQTEGMKGFFVGAPVRVGLKAPNLGVALLVVELLTQVFHGDMRVPDFRRSSPGELPVTPAGAPARA